MKRNRDGLERTKWLEASSSKADVASSPKADVAHPMGTKTPSIGKGISSPRTIVLELTLCGSEASIFLQFRNLMMLHLPKN